GVVRGHGSRFGTVIKSNDNASTDYVMKLGNGTTWEPHNYVMRDLSISAADGAPSEGALLFDRTNLMRLYDVTLQDMGAGGIALGSRVGAVLLGEMIFNG